MVIRNDAEGIRASLEEILQVSKLPRSVAPSVVMQAFNLDPLRLEALGLSLLGRTGNGFLDGSNVLVSALPELLGQDVDLSRGYSPFIQGLNVTPREDVVEEPAVPDEELEKQSRAFQAKLDGAVVSVEVIIPKSGKRNGDEEPTEGDDELDTELLEAEPIDVDGLPTTALAKYTPSGVVKTMIDLFKMREVAANIPTPVPYARSPEEFLSATTVNESEVFPSNYIPESAEKAARTIYRKLKDRITIGEFRRLVTEHSLESLSNLEEPELTRLFYLNRTAAMFGRAGIDSVTYGELGQMYVKLPRITKLRGFWNTALHSTLPEVWGADYLEVLGVGKHRHRKSECGDGTTNEKRKVIDTYWEAADGFNHNKKLNVYDALNSLGTPWLKAIYQAIQFFGRSVRDTARAQLEEIAVQTGKRVVATRKSQRLQLATTAESLDGTRYILRIPTDRRISAETELRFATEDIARIFGYESVDKVEARISLLRERGIEIPRNEGGYDLRDHSIFLIEDGDYSAQASAYTKERAISTIESVLRAERVQEVFIKDDAERVLRVLDEEFGLEVIFGDRYISRLFARRLPETVNQMYDSGLHLKPLVEEKPRPEEAVPDLPFRLHLEDDLPKREEPRRREIPEPRKQPELTTISYASFIPEARRIKDYRGYSLDDLSVLLDYESPAQVFDAMNATAKFGISYPRIEKRFDLRGRALNLIRERWSDGNGIIYVGERLESCIKTLLELEGLDPRIIEADSKLVAKKLLDMRTPRAKALGERAFGAVYLKQNLPSVVRAAYNLN